VYGAVFLPFTGGRRLTEYACPEPDIAYLRDSVENKKFWKEFAYFPYIN
jgi:hypothetical protein